MEYALDECRMTRCPQLAGSLRQWHKGAELLIERYARGDYELGLTVSFLTAMIRHHEAAKPIPDTAVLVIRPRSDKEYIILRGALIDGARAWGEAAGEPPRTRRLR